MVVVAAGMQKSGSGWLFTLLNSLVAMTVGRDCREIRTLPVLRRVVRGHNCQVGPIGLTRYAVLKAFSYKTGPFVVKTHAEPTSVVRAALRRESIRAIYSSRDLRDVALSLQDHAARLRATGTKTALALTVHSYDDALTETLRYFKVWQQWQNLNGVLQVRYEDLVQNTERSVALAAEHLGIRSGPVELSALVARHPAGRGSQDWADGLHFNVGNAYRYRHDLTDDERVRAWEKAGSALQAMGYQGP